MITALSWALVNDRNDSISVRYVVLDHVLIAVEIDAAASTAVAHDCGTVERARELAISHTQADEWSGYRLFGPVEALTTHLSPEKAIVKYRQVEPVGAGLESLLRRLEMGRGTVLA